MTPPEGEASARAIRQLRARRLAIRFALWVVFPTLVSALYYGCVVKAQYESHAIVLLQVNERSPSALNGETSDTASARDAHLVLEYVRSRAMSTLLTERHQFAEHYQSDAVDWFARLDEDAGAEEIHQCYRKAVAINYHSNSGTIYLLVRAYSPEAAQGFAKAILEVLQDELDVVFASSKLERRLVTISEPSYPSSPTLPRRAWSIGTVFVVCLVLMGIFGLLAAAVREHAKF